MSDLATPGHPMELPQPPGQPSQPSQPSQPGKPRQPRPAWVTRADLRAAVGVVGALVVLGAAAGWPWQRWAPRTVALVYSPHALVPDEKEAYVAGDARFVLITAMLGVLVAVLAWSRPRWRSPAMPVALAVGGIAGAFVTDLVGRWTGGGHGTGTVGTVVVPPIGVHATAFLFAEAALALLAYAACVLLSTRDDLGRGDGDGDTAGPPEPGRWPDQFSAAGTRND